MGLNEPTTETRDEILPVGAATSATRDNATTATTISSEPQEPVNERRPPLPARPSASPSAQLPPSARQPPMQQPYMPYQQPPYAPYPYQGQPYPYGPRVRSLPPYSRSWTVSKLVLTILSTTIAIVITALACVLIGQGEAEAASYYALPISIAALLWNGAELITYAIRSRSDVKRGIHPGAHVGLHLCFWLACIFAVLLTVMVSISAQSVIRNCTDEDDSYSYSGYYRSYCEDYYYGDSNFLSDVYLPTIRAILGMFCIATIVHFILFVLACIETHKRNCMKPAGFVVPPPATMGAVYYSQPPPGAVPYYPYPMPMAPQQARVAPQPQMSGGAAPRVPQADVTSQNYQNLAGFYAPGPVPSTGPAPPRASPSPIRATPSPDNEKTVVTTSAPAGTAL